VAKLEEALRNIDIFCRSIVRKMVEKENETEDHINVEPIENLLRRRNILEESSEPNLEPTTLIPLPQIDEPLIDVFEDDDYVRVLMQCRCENQRTTVHTSVDGLEICKKECHKTEEGTEVCVDECKKLNVPVKHLQFENMISKCNNNEVLEIDIPKEK